MLEGDHLIGYKHTGYSLHISARRVMKSTILIITGALLIGVIAGAASLYLWRDGPKNAAQDFADLKQPESMASPGSTAKAGADKRQAEANSIIARAADKFLTGDPDGDAEWRAAKDDSMTCGVTPAGRYLIMHNELGKSQYDEHPGHPSLEFEKAWAGADCETTAPIHQAELLDQESKERLYQDMHPLDPECVERRFKELATGGAEAAKRQSENPHECNRTQAEWNAEMHTSAGQ